MGTQCNINIHKYKRINLLYNLRGQNKEIQTKQLINANVRKLNLSMDTSLLD